jgi:starch phosphorylase
LQRVRASLTQLTPQFSSDRMVREYVTQAYGPAARGYDQRVAGGDAIAKELLAWQTGIMPNWPYVRFEDVSAEREGADWNFWATVHLAGIHPDHVRVELCSVDEATKQTQAIPMQIEPGPGASITCRARVNGSRPKEHFTPRITPHHPARLPTELPLVKWQQ